MSCWLVAGAVLYLFGAARFCAFLDRTDAYDETIRNINLRGE